MKEINDRDCRAHKFGFHFKIGRINQQTAFNILGGMYIVTIFSGTNNASSVLSYISTERTVMYRERYAGMYSSWAYAAAQVTIEVPYIFFATLIYTVITYPMIGYYWSAYKVLWYFYSMFCSLLFFNSLGMLMIAMTPSLAAAAILQFFFYAIFHLFSGFIIPKPHIPKWWIWLYYLTPTSWALNAMFTSQYGDIEEEIMVFGKTKTLASFLQDYYGFHHHQLPLVAVVLLMYPIIFATLFAISISKFNFQKR